MSMSLNTDETKELEAGSHLGDVGYLYIPRVDRLQVPDSSLPALATNALLVIDLEQILTTLEEEIGRIVEFELPKKPDSFEPLSEVERWKERSTILAKIYDQLNSNEVRKILIVLSAAESLAGPIFEVQRDAVYRLLHEARDITRFLGTIERHLLTLSFSTNVQEMIQCIPKLMEGLHLIWMLSRHVKEEQLMMLLEMIAKLLYDRVTGFIHPAVIFLKDPLYALDASDSAKTLFLTWKNTYLSIRDKIERSGKGARWEFDRNKLFPKTDYCALIAQHLSEISVVLLEFKNFFGSEIKSVIGDSKKVDDALSNVYLLVKPFIEIQFDPFLIANGKQWKEMLERLRSNVQNLEIDAKNFIDEAFALNRSAIAAFEVLMKFKEIETRDSIHLKLMKKFDDSIMMYIQEVRTTKEFFEKNKENPPKAYKYVPPISSRIWWVRSLFYMLKKTILVFRTQQDIIETEIGKLACEEYLTLAKQLKAYEDNYYKIYCDETLKCIPLIRKPIFIKVPADKEFEKNQALSTIKEIYKVNLPEPIMMMVQEAMNLEQMGYRINESTRCVSFQRNVYIRHKRRLEIILMSYYDIRKKLCPAEAVLMGKFISEVEKNFDQGLTRLNWTALGIPDYATRLILSLQQFDRIVNQVNKVAKEIRLRLWMIKNGKFWLEPPYEEGKYQIPILDSWDFFNYWSRYRTRVFEKLLIQFNDLPTLFLTLETLIYGTATGSLKQFRPYFRAWEKRIFLFLSKSIIRTLYDYEKRLVVVKPLFNISAILQTPDIRITPTPHEVYQLIMAGALDCVFGTKKFIRWMRGTCKSAPEVTQGDNDEKFIYSYFLDIGRLPRILQLLLLIQDTAQKLLLRIWNLMKKYRKFRNLWRHNKDKTIAAFSLKNPTCKMYDEKMGFYTQLSDRIAEMPKYRVEGCIRINLEPLHTAICHHAREWVVKLGNTLATATKELNGEFDKMVSDFERDLSMIPRTDDDWHTLIKTIKNIRSNCMEVEAKHYDLKGRYSTLEYYRIQYPREDYDSMERNWIRWQYLWLRDFKKVVKKVDEARSKKK